MLGIGFWEMLVIVVLVLVAVGPDRLPEMIRTLAKHYRQLRRTAEDLRASTGIDDLLRDEEIKELAELRRMKLANLLESKTLTPADQKVVEAKIAAAKVIEAKIAAAKELPPPTESAPAGQAATGAPEADEGMLGAAVPRSRTPSPTAGLTPKERALETPIEGVDLAEARRALKERLVEEQRRAETAPVAEVKP